MRTIQHFAFITHHFPPILLSLITSAQNPTIKNLVRLRDARHRKRQEAFLIDGEREVARAIAAAWPLQALYFCPEYFRQGGEAMDLVETADERGVDAVQLSKEAFAKVTYRENPDGLLAQAPVRERSLADLELSANPLILIAEMVEKPGNLGALMRTANAANVDALIVCDPICDLFNPNAIRASQGAFFQLPFVATDTTSARLWLEDRGISPLATTPDTQTLLWDVDLRRPTALVVGTEAVGLSQDWLDGTVATAKLPMAGVTDSLNVSVAAGIALFEAVRQRRG
jgi:TrmH family RNA methyltransferase